MVGRITPRLRKMSTWMEPLQGGTILCSTHHATLTEIDSDTYRDRSMRKLVRSSTKESMFTAQWPIMAWLQGCWLIESTPISPKITKKSTRTSIDSR
jgi:hypothetical protein